MRNKIMKAMIYLMGLSILLACADNSLEEKQKELDRNQTLWQSQGIEHYLIVEYSTGSGGGDALHAVFGYPRTIYISNDDVYSVIIETNALNEIDFGYISNLWSNNQYLIPNTFEFSTNYIYYLTISKRFDEVQKFINEAKNDLSINHLFGSQSYTIDITYNQEYGYSVEMHLNKSFPHVPFSTDYSIIGNLQILD